jgi:RNA recognition motif-containing protein
MDYAAGRHRGFAFVEFKSPDDAAEAIFNMDGAEYMGRVLRVSLAQPNQLRKLASSAASQGGGQYAASSYREEAIWKSDEWFQKQIVEGGDGLADDGNHSKGSAADAQHQEDIKALR